MVSHLTFGRRQMQKARARAGMTLPAYLKVTKKLLYDLPEKFHT